jgi:M6 family metalloprotease-like protein
MHLFSRVPRPSSKAVVVTMSIALLAAVAGPVSADPVGHAPPITPVDPASWKDPADMTWDEYQEVPNTDWSNPELVPTVDTFRVALVVADFPDLPYAVTLPLKSNVFGNPVTTENVPRDDVPEFLRDFLNKPQELNHGVTMNSYWMETSTGRYGVQLDSFGTYELPRPHWDYFSTDFQGALNQSLCPSQANVVGTQTGVTTLEVDDTSFFSVNQVVTIPLTSPNGTTTRTIVAIPDSTHVELSSATTANRPVVDGARIHTCNANFRTDSLAAWRAEQGQTINSQYDNIFYVSPGQDESGSWQEFGEMIFPTTTDCDGYSVPYCGVVPDAFGNPNPKLPNWAGSRYIPWSSWASVSTIWPNASGNTSIEGESSGMAVYAHELTHNLSIGDNYNNPFDTIPQRSATAYWDMMSRGSFNGPGGTHTRWEILPTQGSALGSSHNLRNKIFLGFVSEANVLRLNRNGLAQSGVAVSEITARVADPGPDGLMGVNIALDGSAPIDKAPACVNTAASPNPFCANPVFQNFTIEAVQRLGNDTFDPGNGVLISKTRNTGGQNCGRFTCFVWIIDAHPEDIDLIDFYRPDGTPVPVVIGDPRQLQDAAFNAGLAEGTEFEWEDPNNRLHFYVIDLTYDADGIRHYTVAVRSLDGSGPQTRGVGLAAGKPQGHTPAWAANCNFPLTNTGAAAATPDVHPEDVSANLTSDVYRLSIDAPTGNGWSAQLYSALTTAEFGETVNVPVYVTRVPTSTGNTTITLRATSESDPSKTATSTCKVNVANTTPAN